MNSCTSIAILFYTFYLSFANLITEHVPVGIDDSQLFSESTSKGAYFIDMQNSPNSLAEGIIEGRSTSKIEATLSRHNDSGVIRIFLPNISDAHPVCYPETFLQHSEAAKLIHVLCKQLGYITFNSRYKETHPYERFGVLSTSSQCTGVEDKISQCPWKNIKTQLCRDVLATSCTQCYHTLIASNGSISNPGFPHTYLYSVTCEWKVEIPQGSSIDLWFEKFALPKFNNDECESYVEIAYGFQKPFMLCPSHMPQKFFIPNRSVRIRFASGLFHQKYQRQQSHYGFNILFKAVLSEPSGNRSLKVAIVCGIFAFSLVFCISFYCCRRTKHVPNQRAMYMQPNVPTQDQTQAAFEFHRNEMMASQKETNNISESFNVDENSPEWNTAAHPKNCGSDANNRETRISIANTPRNRSLKNGSRSERINQSRTTLEARFSASSAHNKSDISLLLPTADCKNYSKHNCNEDIPPRSGDNGGEKKPTEESYTTKDVPDIVVEYVKK